MSFNFQSDDPAVKWQLNLYKDVLKSEEPSNPEKTVERVQRISAAVFHLEQVRSICRGLRKQEYLGEYKAPVCTHLLVKSALVRQKTRSKDHPSSHPDVILTLHGSKLLNYFPFQCFKNFFH